MQYSRVRTAIATALGQFAAPQQASLAQRSAQALGALLEKGDAASYIVEAAAAAASGKTRAEGSVDQLLKVMDASIVESFGAARHAGGGNQGKARS